MPKVLFLSRLAFFTLFLYGARLVLWLMVVFFVDFGYDIYIYTCACVKERGILSTSCNFHLQNRYYVRSGIHGILCFFQFATASL